MTNDEVLYTLSNKDYYHLLEDKETVLKMMEKSGLALEIAVALPDSTTKQLLTDKDCLSKALNKEILKNSNLTGGEIIASIMVQLIQNDELTNNKEFMTGLMNDLVEIANGDRYYMLDEAMTYILSKKCDGLFKEKDFSNVVFNFYEKMGCLEYAGYKDIAEKMLKLSDVPHDKELALKYAECFSRVDGIDQQLFEDEEFLKQILENQNIYLGNVELPEKYYSNPDILREYIERKCGEINKIHFDFDNEDLKRIFMENYNYSMESYMRDYIRCSIEQDKEIVVSGYDESIDYDDAISAIQQWAEDEDLIKIGEKIHVVNKPEGEIIEGKLNIVTGDNVKNSITEGTISVTGCSINNMEIKYNDTIILNGYKFADIIKQLGIDTRIDMDKIQNQYDEMIENLKQKCEETRIMPHDVIDVVRNANIVNNGENCINMKKDEESGKTKAVLSIAHPVYLKKYQDVELDGEELKEIIELANNNSYEDAQRKLEEITQKGIGKVSTTCNYATLARFENRDIKQDVIGTIGEGTNTPYLIGRKELLNGKIPDFKCIMPYETVYYEGIHDDGLGTKFVELEMNEEQVKEFNHKEKEIVENIQDLACKKTELQKKEQNAKKLLEQYEELNGNKNKSGINQ
jgi:hypothetical protein